jgi:uncharacterized protein YgbK (DUF1537 family)
MSQGQIIKTLVAKMRSQRKTFPEGATHQTVSEVAQAFDSLLKGRESYIEMIRLAQDAIKSKDARIAEIEKEREDLRVRLSKAETESCEAKAIRDLEQQAKGIESLITSGGSIEQSYMNSFYRREATELRNQTKVLKEQDK